MKAANQWREAPSRAPAAGERAALAGERQVSGELDVRSNDYLGLGGVSRETTSPSRAGAGASRLISGTWREHLELEQRLAAWLGTEAALVFSSGYAANVGTLSALAGPGEVIFSDALNHASIIDGCRLSRAEVVVLPHADAAALERALERQGPVKWVVTESYFSMDGDSPDLRRIRALCDRHDAALIVDEAHALGVFGPSGRGLCAEAGVVPDLLVGGFGKAFGLQGGFVAGARVFCEWLWNRARSFVYSTAISPAQCEMLAGRLEEVAGADALRRHLQELEGRLAECLSGAGVQLTPGRHGPIFPVIIGDEAAAMRAAAAVAARGVRCHAVRPPTVPRGSARLRVTLRADMTAAEVERIADVLITVARGAFEGRAAGTFAGPDNTRRETAGSANCEGGVRPESSALSETGGGRGPTANGPRPRVLETGSCAGARAEGRSVPARAARRGRGPESSPASASSRDLGEEWRVGAAGRACASEGSAASSDAGSWVQEAARGPHLTAAEEGSLQARAGRDAGLARDAVGEVSTSLGGPAGTGAEPRTDLNEVGTGREWRGCDAPVADLPEGAEAVSGGSPSSGSDAEPEGEEGGDLARTVAMAGVHQRADGRAENGGAANEPSGAHIGERGTLTGGRVQASPEAEAGLGIGSVRAGARASGREHDKMLRADLRDCGRAAALGAGESRRAPAGAASAGGRPVEAIRAAQRERSTPAPELQNPGRWVILGTGTGVGKTYVALALVSALADRGVPVAGVKPVETGVGSEGAADARALERASFHVKHPYPHPLYAFAPPLTPSRAARLANETIRLDAIQRWLSQAASLPGAPRAELVVETAGGVFSPIADGITNFDLAACLTPARWLLVAADRLGVLHDVGSCLRALDSLGHAPDAIVLSAPETPDPSTGTNVDELRRTTTIPILSLARNDPAPLTQLLQPSPHNG